MTVMKIYLPLNTIVSNYTEYKAWLDKFISKPVVNIMTTDGVPVDDNNWDKLNIDKLANDLCCFHELGIDDMGKDIHILSSSIGRTFEIDNMKYWDQVELKTGTNMDLYVKSNER